MAGMVLPFVNCYNNALSIDPMQNPKDVKSGIDHIPVSYEARKCCALSAPLPPYAIVSMISSVTRGFTRLVALNISLAEKSQLLAPSVIHLIRPLKLGK